MQISTEAIESVASWMAYETFVFPRNLSLAPYDVDRDPDKAIDLMMLVACLNFAFTDFETGETFIVQRDGEQLVDTDGMSACLHEALERGEPLLDGAHWTTITEGYLDTIFEGSITMPLNAERAQILNDVGRRLVERYDGHFHTFIRDCEPAMYADGQGMLERLVREFPRFDDVSTYRGQEVQLHKLAQLALWSLRGAELIELRDLDRMTAFADYIVPVALRVMGILTYSPELEATITERGIVARDSDEEIEIRASTLVATAQLTDAINRRRPDDRQVIIPQIDYRLWKTYHATFWPHHLTPTTMY
ncbi:queuosine salvage family protein [Euzebya sp.]|uniref:queuosine salvage family protein n=1 Tax=Euzebya sp. TaxID=1971409 RepID=UPI003511BFE6